MTNIGHHALTSLLYAASDGRHRPASHPLLSGQHTTRPIRWSGWRIRARRQALGMSQDTLAAAVGVSRPAVSMWESSASQPTGEHLLRLQAVLA